MDDHREKGVNVKVYGLPRADRLDELTEDETQGVYDNVQEGFWIALESASRDQFGCGVYAEGRMGGWAVPEKDLLPTQFVDWTTMVEELLKHFTTSVWPEAVKERVERIDKQREMREARRLVVIIGNVGDGFTAYGPIDDIIEVQDLIDRTEDEWTIMELRTVAELEN